MTDPIIVVSGLPRAGTSLMMQMLAAGGIPVLTDGARPPDADNPRGYYEYEPATRIRADASWLANAGGKAVKLVYLLLYDLPRQYAYRVILMQRPLTEVIASQQAMLKRQNRAGTTLADARLEQTFASQLARLDAWLPQQAHISVLRVNHRDLVTNPQPVVQELDRFLGPGLDREAMRHAVDVTLYRQRH